MVMKRQGPRGAVGCVDPMHKELAIGTLYNVLKLVQVTVDEFVENL
jgi:hypothetical protein